MGNTVGREQREQVDLRRRSAGSISTSSLTSSTSQGNGGGGSENAGARNRHHDRVTATIRQALNLEDTVDGGFLVPQGVYTGPQDYKIRIVKQLMVERRLAPFFKGLEDYDDAWTDVMLLAAIRGQPIPAPEPPVTRSRSGSATADIQSGPTAIQTRTRTNTATSLSSLSSTKSAAVTDKRQALDVLLYRGAVECPICFLYYPPYLNSTRCCDQSICSECFVQIKRPDPHVPAPLSPSSSSSPPAAPAAPAPEASVSPIGVVKLTSEPASCPYCTETDFGVTYRPPPFRSGASVGGSGSSLRVSFSRHSSAATSATSLASSAPAGTRKRRATLPSTAAEVVTTDRVRPDWAIKLASANAHAARRAAAATALHAAAFLVGRNGNGDHGDGSTGRRHHRTRRLLGGAVGLSSSSSRPSTPPPQQQQGGQDHHSSDALSSSSRRAARRMVDLEEMMVMEAIRISLLDSDRQSAQSAQGSNDDPAVTGDRLSASSSESNVSVTGAIPGTYSSLAGQLIESSNRDDGDNNGRANDEDGEERSRQGAEGPHRSEGKGEVSETVKVTMTTTTTTTSRHDREVQAA
ncbi:hypothetical protein V1514DRAFT_46211 [Lipomyces japonicus]|uniref:uncharacterized protein n=1 Tax=Lipomyces japonicus TaxID=56871 RepID=UPI0034CEE84E